LGGGCGGVAGTDANPLAATAIPAATQARTSAGIPSKEIPNVNGAATINAATASTHMAKVKPPTIISFPLPRSSTKPRRES